MSIRQQVYQKFLSKHTLSQEDMAELALWCEEKPLFAPAQMLLLHALKSNEDHRFQARQKKAALVCPDREALFNYLNPIDVLEPSKPSLDFTPPKKQDIAEQAPSTALEKTQDIKTEKAKEGSTKSPDVEKEKPIQTTQTKTIKTTAANKNQEKTVDVKEPTKDNTTKLKASADSKPSTPVASKPVSETNKSDSTNDWEARIAALKAKSKAIIAKTKHVSKDEDIPDSDGSLSKITPSIQTDKSKSNDSKTMTESKDIVEPKEIKIDVNAEDVNAKKDVDTQSSKHTATVDDTPHKADENKNSGVSPAHDDRKTTKKEKPPLSFNDWLQRLNSKNEPITEPEETSNEQLEEKREKWQRVDAFLQKLPEITPPRRPMLDDRPSSPVAFSKEPLDDNELITETLAKLYVNQGLIDKAIEAYEILQLNIPEKSHLFKRQIQSLKEMGKK